MLKITKKIIAIVFLFVINFGLFQLPALAQSWSFDANSGLDNTAAITGHSESKGGFSNNGVSYIVSVIITAILSLVGVVFLSLLIYGGYLWLIDQGNEDNIKKAKGIILNAFIGLVVTLSAYAISYFVIATFANRITSK